MLQLLGKRAQEEGSQKVQAAMAGVTALLEALEQVMEPGHYIQALLVLLQEPQEALIPRVVRLFEASISKATDAPTVQAAMQFCTQVTLNCFSCVSWKDHVTFCMHELRAEA